MPPAEASLKRSLGTVTLSFYGVGLILGAGIYSILGEAAGEAGHALWWSFLLASLAALLTGLSYAELSTMYPKAGAEYVYLREAFPRARWMAGVVGWLLTAAGAATAATVALAFGGYARLFVDAPTWLPAVLLLVGATALNAVGIRESSWANVAFTLVEALGLVVLVVVGATTPGFGRAFLAVPHAGVLAGAGLVFFAYLGFEEIANLAEETKDPARSLPRAILVAVVVSTVLYVLVAAASVALLEPARLAQSASPLADAVAQRAPQFAGALGGVALFATANTALLSITAASRMVFGMARGGDAPRPLGRLLPGRGTPLPALVLVLAASFAFLGAGGVGTVGSAASALALVAFASVNVALARLRFLRPEAPRPFRVPGSLGRLPLLPTLGTLVAVLVLAQFEPPVYAWAGAAIAIAVAAQLARRGRAKA